MLRLLLADLAARAIHPVVEAYAARYHTRAEGETDSGNPEYDRRSTIAGQFEVAANRDHDSLEVIAKRRMGFTSSGRAT